MGKRQCQVPPPTPLQKGPELRVILSYQPLNIYLRPHMAFKMETVAIKRTDEINLLWYKQVFLVLKIPCSWVCVTTVYQGASRTEATLT